MSASRWWMSAGWMLLGALGCAVVPTPNPAMSEKTTNGSLFSGLPAVGAITAGGQTVCTGTVIKPRVVVTAAHCVTSLDPGEVKFIVGPNAARPQKAVNIAKLVPHPAYRAGGFHHDIAYLELEEDAGVQPLGVLKKLDRGFIGKQLLFVGYGRDGGTGEEGPLGGQKHAAVMSITALNDMKFRYEKNGPGEYRGDSGSPGLYRARGGEYLLAGVTSCSSASCESFGVDTRVDAYLHFLGLRFFAQPLPEIRTGCGKENRGGRCEGRTLVFCENDCFETAIKRINCEAMGKECYSDRVMGWSRCQ